MKYALLTYGFPDLPNISNSGNIIQSIAAAQFLPQIDELVPMLEMDKYMPTQRTKIILNGYWFSHYYSDDRDQYLTEQEFHVWENVEPLLISMHLESLGFNEPVFRVRDEARSFFQRFGPVGTRDESSTRVLSENSIDAYKSLCLTLTLKKREWINKTNKLLLIDVSDKLAKKFKKESDDEALDLTHMLKHYWTTPGTKGIEEIAVGEYLLDMIQSSRMVITGRLHVALPALALGTPCVFIPDTGENGKKNGIIKNNARLSDYTSILRTLYTKSILNGEANIDVNSPKDNSDRYLEYREELIKKVEDYIGKECPYAKEMYRCSAYNKIVGLDNDSVINLHNHMITELSIIQNRYRDQFLKKFMIRTGMALKVLSEPNRFYLKGDK